MPGAPWLARRGRTGRLGLAIALAGASWLAASSVHGAALAPSTLVPRNAYLVAYENLEGAIVTSIILRGSNGRDTTGRVVLDTGAGYLALDPRLIQALGIADHELDDLTFAPRPLPRLRLGMLEQHVVAPVLSVNTEVIEQVTDRAVFGLLGQAPLESFALWIDYRSDTLALIPMPRDGQRSMVPRRMVAPDLAAGMAAFTGAREASRAALGAAISAAAVPLPFRLEGDGKILVRVRAGATSSRTARAGEARTRPASGRRAARAAAESPPELNLVLDTGATKTVFFEDAVRDRMPGFAGWKQLRGLSAPTLYGAEEAYLVRVPEMSMTASVGVAIASDVDVAVIGGALAVALERAVGSPVDGLLGYSFLRRFRTVIDYPHRVIWLDPMEVTRDQRPYEYSHVGIQIERRDGALRVVAVAEGSPAAAAGIRNGDALVSVDATPAAGLDVTTAAHRLEGAPGSRVVLEFERGGTRRTYTLKRRQLL